VGKFWDDDMREWLESYGFKESTADPSILIKHMKSGWIKLLSYVDDQLYFGSTREAEEQFERDLGKRFNIDLKGDAHWFLSTWITRHNKDYTLDQAQYSINLLNKYQPENCRWGRSPNQHTPLPPGMQMSAEWCPMTKQDYKEIEGRFGGLDYRSCIGSLIYLAAGTQYDILYAMTKLAKFAKNPGMHRYECLYHLLGYLNRTRHYGIRYYHDIRKSPVTQIYLEDTTGF
jgi:hypothetical protein